MSGHYVGQKCECQFEFPGLSDVSKLRVSLQRPGSKTEETLEVTKGPGESVLVSFIPEVPGEHQLSMLVSGRHVSGSPFPIPVTESPAATVTGNPMSLALELPGVNLPADFEHLTAKLQRPGKFGCESTWRDHFLTIFDADNLASQTQCFLLIFWETFL